MTEDAQLVALTAHVEAAAAKLVLVGDHHQLGAVGPGGALAALARRHPAVVHSLRENRRQHDPAERASLAQLRDGEVAKAVAWYTNRGRLHAAAERDTALQQAVDAWAGDAAAGHPTGLYAWRRANVAALNQRARQWMDATGRLSGPELACPGGNTYRAGDRVVTLAPGAEGRLVTSQRAVIAVVDPSTEALNLRTDDGQHVQLAKQEAGADRLDYGYATTVHRSQGSTTERAHLFADGGGRELAYVAMSRARESTQIWTVADDLPQAVDDLRRDWSTRRTPTWALDAALPDRHTLTRERFQALPKHEQARQAALAHAETALAGHAMTGMALPDRPATLGQAETALAQARQVRADLETGRGFWQDSDAGQAVTRSRPGPPGPPTCRAGRRTRSALARPPRRPQTSWAVGAARTRRPTALGNPRRSGDYSPRRGDRPSTKPASTAPPIASKVGWPQAERSLTMASNSNGTPRTSPNVSTPSATTSTASHRPPRYAELLCNASN